MLALSVLVIAFVLSSLTLGAFFGHVALVSMVGSLLLAPVAGAYVRRCNEP